MSRARSGSTTGVSPPGHALAVRPDGQPSAALRGAQAVLGIRGDEYDVAGTDVRDAVAAMQLDRAVLTGQQFQSEEVEPYYVLFEDFTHVKFYRRSLYDGCISQRATFDGFVHVDDWVPQRLVTATGPNPLPR
jgi:hypothetical protein